MSARDSIHGNRHQPSRGFVHEGTAQFPMCGFSGRAIQI